MKKIAVVLCALAGLAVTPAAHAAEPDCTFTDAFCACDQTNYEGARFTVSPIGSSACVDLVEHGWDNRIRSACNNSTKTASLFASDDCTGRPYPIDGRTGQPDIRFQAGSVFVQR
ncbi:peptidase inhibitor family I36 protein [Lentzea sp. BCCO 10_0798]|uniref:Peptidase inhibitor family I36 protein n=1 Tax=Lentzea kristufekii TaxID=3095430 RepID=A0ABU4U298_9PSEU|nr:peptidase inhibitor family I36 protein [Lentzea sp. BCCO 10_0798]MDX8054510.1 peptidase inhibitor family I36 protein [Lentzea sp. BCCO 10_0798]